MNINRIITLKNQVSGMSPTNNNLQEALIAAIIVIIELTEQLNDSQREIQYMRKEQGQRYSGTV